MLNCQNSWTCLSFSLSSILFLYYRWWLSLEKNNTQIPTEEVRKNGSETASFNPLPLSLVSDVKVRRARRGAQRPGILWSTMRVTERAEFIKKPRGNRKWNASSSTSGEIRCGADPSRSFEFRNFCKSDAKSPYISVGACLKRSKNETRPSLLWSSEWVKFFPFLFFSFPPFPRSKKIRRRSARRPFHEIREWMITGTVEAISRRSASRQICTEKI